MLAALIFDLDGVLIDSLASIRGSMNHALAAFGLPLLVGDEARAHVGPPLAKTAPLLLGTSDPAAVERFIRIYREHYRESAAETTAAMPGLQEVIPALADRWPLAIATSKPELYARPLLERFAVAERFAAICGASLEHHRDTKATIIARVLRRLGLDPRGEHAGRIVMVGDRSYDVEGAAAHGIPTIGAAYGMGGAEELRRAGARWQIDGLAELIPLLDRLDAAKGSPRGGAGDPAS